MAIYPELDLTNQIKDLETSWEGKSGKEVEDFISRRLKGTVGGASFANHTLKITNPEGEVIAETPVTLVEPNFNTKLTFKQLVVDGNTYNESNPTININYNDRTKFIAGLNLETYYESLGETYYLSKAVDITFYITQSPTEQLIVKNVLPNTKEDTAIREIDITELFQTSRKNVTIEAYATANDVTGSATFIGSITVNKIELSTETTIGNNNSVNFKITGLDDYTGMSLYYYAVKLGDNIPTSPLSQGLTSSEEVTLILPDAGAYQIVARIADADFNNAEYYSNWVTTNVVVAVNADESETTMAIISGIPETISNCENANLYKIIYVPGLSGEIEISSYLAEAAGLLGNNTDWSPYLFDHTTFVANAHDDPSTTNYYSYVELTSVGSAQRFAAFKIKIDGVEHILKRLYVNNQGALRSSNYFTINIVENPYNVNNAFNYSTGAVVNFSQITGQSTDLFTDINEDIETSDGWMTDEDRVTYKISGQDKDLFSVAKDYTDTLNATEGFTIEVMLKNYNINGDDPVMNIGNILFGPGYLRVNSTNTSDEIYVNSRADFEKEVITHLTIVYDPDYKPTTYTDIYDQVYNSNGNTFSKLNHSYPILKIFVNGTINREIQINKNLLTVNNKFEFQIHPISSDLNLYIFRTYNRAFNYAEVQKNYISSRPTSEEKKAIYDRNNILDSNGKISFHKAKQKHNVLLFVLPNHEKPLYFGNRDTCGDGIDSLDETKKARVTVLVHYKDADLSNPENRLNNYCGRFCGTKLGKSPKYKAQGSSAKKYMFHNTQISDFTFLSEPKIKAGLDQYVDGTTKYAMPNDPEGIKAEKLVGKVNYASSMQSHKQGSIKLFDQAYKSVSIFGPDKLYNEGKKACFEEAFMYFYCNVDESKLDTITLDDLYTVTNYNGVDVADDGNIKFIGFQTWGSAKADDPTYGYGDNTPEYLLLEGADNGSPGANFKQPWAAFQTWDDEGNLLQQNSRVTESDFTTGLKIDGETIRFEGDTDPWDVDYGIELLIKDGQTEDQAEEADLWKFTDTVKTNSLPYWVAFYNNCYQYDFTNLILNPSEDKSKFDLTKSYECTNMRVYMNQPTSLYKNGQDSDTKAQALDVYRWDKIKACWVPAGLHYEGSNWRTYNLVTEYNKLKNTALYQEFSNSGLFTADFDMEVDASEESLYDYIVPAFKDMFKANIEKYCDKDDIAYHQAFIRLVSGTDNRAKNTYFQIIGKLYEQDSETEEWRQGTTGDYKIRLMQDDLDTIFATDNNGQQVKPYYLLEPPFNKETENMWGDEHSSFFYPFDVCYSDLINTYTGKLIDFLIGSATDIKSDKTKLYEYFFSTQLQFPEIAYNHHAEIYYESTQTVYSGGNLVTINGQNPFKDIIGDFNNNAVQNPLSLSHGRCLESEYQFMKDRLLMLGTGTTTGSGLYTADRITLSDEETGSGGDTYLFKAVGEFTDYFYPIRTVHKSNEITRTKIGNINDPSETSIVYDSIFSNILPVPGIPDIIKELVTPDESFNINCEVTQLMGTYLSASTKYKSLTITDGLDLAHNLLQIPNLKTLIVQTKYDITERDVIVKNRLPVIEVLRLGSTTFNDSILDFRGCNRLTELDLSECDGILDIILPENNRLREVHLPKDLKQLTLGNNPRLSKIVFHEETKLTTLSLDCSAINESLDYIDILTNRVDYANLEQLVINNTPESGLKITEDVAFNFAMSEANKKITTLIAGKFIITNREKNTDSEGNVYYTWGSETDIKYTTKKRLVEAFGNIESTTNRAYFEFITSSLLSENVKLAKEITVYTSSGEAIKPFEALYFTTGNNVRIKSDGTLDITYSISGIPSEYNFNTNTGVVNKPKNDDVKRSYKITINRKTGTALIIEGWVTFGYRIPEIGDFAYADGTFSSYYDSDKDLVGMVFQKQTESSSKWHLGIVSNKVIEDYAGPDYYYKTGDNWYETDTDHKWVYNLLTNSEGFGLSGDNLTIVYTGLESSDFPSHSNRVEYNSNVDVPTELVNSGREYTTKLVEIAKSRINTVISKSLTFKRYLENNSLWNSENSLDFSAWNLTNFQTIKTQINDCISLDMTKNVTDAYKVIHPLAFSSYLFEPTISEGKTLDEKYTKGNWYVPSIEEVELLIWYRIRSTTPSSEKELGYLNWNSKSYTRGDSIFTTNTAPYIQFLDNTEYMLSVPISPSNKNFVYGTNTPYWGGTTTYGWYSMYALDSSGYEYGGYNSNCKRDFKYSIAPCCQITVEKPILS